MFKYWLITIPREKVPERADEGLLITSASLVSFTRVALQSFFERPCVQFKQVIVVIVEID